MNKVIALLIIASTGSSWAATIQTNSVYSKKMDKNVPVIVVTPDSYEEGSQDYPVTYLLHGAGGSYTDWTQWGGAAPLADKHQMILVCPDGGVTSWYFDSPIDPTYQYETFVAKECVEYIDAHFRTKTDRSQRAICGLSMGGHGALYLAIRHRDTFSISVPLSGGVDIRPFAQNWDISKRLGNAATHKASWDEHAAITQAKSLKDGDLFISIDCGQSDFFVGVNRALHGQLLEDGITHFYVEYPGEHTQPYWVEAIKRQLVLVEYKFNNPTR